MFVLAGMAYSYLASGPIEALIGRVRRRGRPDLGEIPAVEPDAMSSGTDGPVPFS